MTTYSCLVDPTDILECAPRGDDQSVSLSISTDAGTMYVALPKEDAEKLALELVRLTGGSL